MYDCEVAMPALGSQRHEVEYPMSEPNRPPPRETEPVRATAHLPGLEVEIVHGRSVEGDREQISITIQAMPSFAAFEQHLRTMNPFALWVDAVRLVWAPWLPAAPLPFVDSPRLTNADPRADVDKPK
jgi:hypothetical protein